YPFFRIGPIDVIRKPVGHRAGIPVLALTEFHPVMNIRKTLACAAMLRGHIPPVEHSTVIPAKLLPYKAVLIASDDLLFKQGGQHRIQRGGIVIPAVADFDPEILAEIFQAAKREPATWLFGIIGVKQRIVTE